ncbi:Trafficking protein particle complex subunit 10 (Trafficking protein particle complex subunit TMEM1) (Transport protein particle subunit TMEM1) (TRAPP subunit TMEM1) [Durusdinium trenchii]|uniref:Trafficking protein particle complex subunit 10 (Trafficking protein particle complex subunit TMEM1) (Transport protein particle subunit TMEM1) (TRAPP subunit TMEM1) n=1 Tax=Durusdinium trenchii TaxID=1381693 RepID=A0ABP0R705_9DINO
MMLKLSAAMTQRASGGVPAAARGRGGGQAVQGETREDGGPSPEPSSATSAGATAQSGLAAAETRGTQVDRAEEDRLEGLTSALAMGMLVGFNSGDVDLDEEDTEVDEEGDEELEEKEAWRRRGERYCRAMEDVLEDGRQARYVLPNPRSGVQRVTICVHDPDNLWSKVEPGFRRRLASMSYSWGVRTIEDLQVEVVGPDHACLGYHISSPLDAYKLPYMHLYVLQCASLEDYRAAVRPRVRAWVDDIQQSSDGLEKNEYILLFVPRIQGTADLDRQLAAAKKVFDKMRTDFGDGKNDRCCKLSLLGEGGSFKVTDAKGGVPSLEAQRSQSQSAGDGEWGEMMHSFCKCLVTSFENRCRKFEDQVLKMEAQADVPGWNYCTYLIAKENLAFTWLQLGQYYDALRILDGLTLQFDNILEGNVEGKQATNKIHIDLYRTQVLRTLVKHDSFRGFKKQERRRRRKEVERKRKDEQASDQRGESLEESIGAEQVTSEGEGEDFKNGKQGCGEDAGGDDSGSTSSSEEAEEDAGQLLGQSKVIAGRLARKLSTSLSFGPKGQFHGAKRLRAESAMRRIASTSVVNLIVPCHLLDIKRKPFREQIYKSSISVLEIRLYLFIRSTLLLFAVERGDEALRRTVHFISSFVDDMIKAAEDSTKDSGAGGPGLVETQMIALSWAFASCLEMICASHAARAGFQSPDPSSDTLLYQAELLAFASTSLERMVADTNRGGAESADVTAAELELTERCLRVHRWIRKLPTLLSRTSTIPWTTSDQMRTWLPPGLFSAMEFSSSAAKLHAYLAYCRAEYLYVAGQPRSAFRVNLRRAFILASHGLLEDGVCVLDEMLAHRGISEVLKFWPWLVAEAHLLRAHILRKLPSQELRTKEDLFKVLSLDKAFEAQRIEALDTLDRMPRQGALQNGDEIPRLSGRTFDLVQLAVQEISPSWPGEGLFAGDQLHVSLRATNKLPRAVVVPLLYVRFRRLNVDQDISQRQQGPAKAKVALDSFVNFRTSDEVDISLFGGSGMPMLDAANVLDEENLESDDDTEVDEDEDEDDSGSRSRGEGNKAAERGASSATDNLGPAAMPDKVDLGKALTNRREELARAAEVDEYERLRSPVSPPSARTGKLSKIKYLRGGNGKSAAETLHQAHCSKFLYFEARDVRLERGTQMVQLKGPSSNRLSGRVVGAGAYVLDRAVTNFHDTLLVDVRDVGSADQNANLELGVAPQVLDLEVVSPKCSFLALNDVAEETLGLQLSVKVHSERARLVKLVAHLDGVDDGLEDTPFRRAPNSEDHVEVEVPAGETEETPTVEVDLVADVDLSPEVDRLILQHKTDADVLRRKGLVRTESSALSSFTIVIDFDASFELVEDGALVEISQRVPVRLRFGRPFEISHAVRLQRGLASGTLWFTVTLKNLLPFAVDVDDTNVTHVSSGDSVQSSSTGIPCRVGAGHELQLTFAAPLPEPGPTETSASDSSVHTFEFLGQYRGPASGSVRRKLSLRSVTNKPSATMRCVCVNQEELRVGSTATFTYTITRAPSSTTCVEAVFSSRFAVINVSSSPQSARNPRRRSYFEDDPKGGEGAAPSVSPPPPPPPPCLLAEGEVSFQVSFDPVQWMIAGTERGHISLLPTGSITVEFIPLQSGELCFPSLEMPDLEVVDASPVQFARVQDD